MQTVAVLQRKGGVSKTTLSVGLSAALSSRCSVLLVDADPQGSAAAWLVNHRGFPIIKHAETTKAVVKALDTATSDVVVIDGPPYDAEMTSLALGYADLTIVPVTPSGLDIWAAVPLLEAIQSARKLGLVIMCQTGNNNASRLAREVVAGYGIPVAETELKTRVAHREASVVGKPVTEYMPSSAAAIEIKDLAEEVWVLLGRG